MKLYLHTIIALLSLIIGYPYGGSIFILLVLPYLVYMVMKQNAIFLPALILHAASETSATTVIFISMILLCILKFKYLIRLKIGVVFWTLILLLPIFIWLFLKRIALSDSIPQAFSYIWYYLSFFAFLFGVLIEKTLSRRIMHTIFISIFIVLMLYMLDIISFRRIIVAFTYMSLAYFPTIILRKSPPNLMYLFPLFGVVTFFMDLEDKTLTNILIAITSFGIVWLYFKQYTNSILISTSILPFVLIFFLYFYGISNYLGVGVNYDKFDVDNLQTITDRISFKFFADRAPFWAGGFNQIVQFKPLFPMPDMPDLTATLISGSDKEVTFGAHTTFIELIRKYGIIAGIALGWLLIYIVIVSRSIFKSRYLDSITLSFFAMAFTTTIIVSLTGQFQILPSFALLSLGVIGIAYARFKKEEKII